jgi:hypothetical protein
MEMLKIKDKYIILSGLSLYLIFSIYDNLYQEGFLYCIQSNINSEYFLNSKVFLG